MLWNIMSKTIPKLPLKPKFFFLIIANEHIFIKMQSKRFKINIKDSGKPFVNIYSLILKCAVKVQLKWQHQLPFIKVLAY